MGGVIGSIISASTLTNGSVARDRRIDEVTADSWQHNCKQICRQVVALLPHTVKESTNQRPAFSRKSLEHDGMIIRSEAHIVGESIVPA